MGGIQMITRLIENSKGQLHLLCSNGSIVIPNEENNYLSSLLIDFKLAKDFAGSDGCWKDHTPEISMYPGKTIAYVTNNKELVIVDFEPFKHILESKKPEYLSTEEYGKKFNKSAEIVKVFCRQGRIFGAVKIGSSWFVPKDAPYPVPQEYRREGSPKAGRPRKHPKKTQS